MKLNGFRVQGFGFKGLGLRVLGFGVTGFRVKGFRRLGLKVFRVTGRFLTCLDNMPVAVFSPSIYRLGGVLPSCVWP